MPKVNREQITGFSMPLPPLELQNRFADFVRQADKSKFFAHQSLKEAQSLFNTITNEYFG
jgi:type I restriction enzyme S subunit